MFSALIENKNFIASMLDIIVKASGKRLNYIQRRRWEKRFNQVLLKGERRFTKTMRKYFRDMEQDVLSKINQKPPKSQKASFSYNDWLFSEEYWNEKLASEGGKFIKEMYSEMGREVFDDLKLMVGAEFITGAFNISEEAVLAFIDNYKFKFATSINATAAETLRGVMKEGMASGLGMEGISQKVREAFDGMTSFRSMLIARTEAIRASNAGQEEAYKQSGVVIAKEWLVAQDDRLCNRCAPMNGKILPLDDIFIDDDYEDIQYPPLHPNCRCCLIPVVNKKYLKAHKKGGPGSGNWNGPGDPRFNWVPSAEGEERKPRENMEIAQLFTERHSQMHHGGGVSDYTNSKHLETAIAQTLKEVQFQIKSTPNARDWYSKDIADSFDKLSKHFPELKEAGKQDFFATLLAVSSPNQDPKMNMRVACDAYKVYRETGLLPLKNPENGMNWSGTNSSPAFDMINKLIKINGGEQQMMYWLHQGHTGKEINEVRQSVNLKPSSNINKGGAYNGIAIFGPKVGQFHNNIMGKEGLTLDVWMTRAFHRQFGTLINSRGEIRGAPETIPERQAMTKWVNGVAKKSGMKAQEVQAIVWYYEQHLWKAAGSRKAVPYKYSEAVEVWERRNQ